MRKVFYIPIVLMCLFSSSKAFSQVDWTKYATPVVKRTAVFPNWKGLATGDPFVMKDNDTLKMWYSGVGWLNASDDCPHVRMGYAWSLDGIQWNDYVGNPVLQLSADTSQFDADGIETPTVIKDLAAPPNQRYKLWYAGRKKRCLPVNDHNLGYAFSPDGINWTRYFGNPVLVPGNNNSWYNTFISGPSVLLDAGIYKMWFTASDLVLNGQPTDGKGNIGFASSVDGINWAVHPSPVLIAGDQGNWDSASIAEPSVIKVKDTFYMFYSALDKWAIENFQVGFASSTDGIHWKKSTRNPVLPIGSSGKWDRYWASHPSVIYDNRSSRLRMWYTGRDTATINSLTGYFWDIGYAEGSFSPGLGEKADGEITIFPNPAKNTLYFNLSFPINNADITIYTALGQIKKRLSNLNSRNISINTIDFSNGLYFLVLKNGNEQYSTKIVIVK